jgi:hypothetical protein
MALSDTLSEMVIRIDNDLNRIDYDSKVKIQAQDIRERADSLRKYLDTPPVVNPHE